MINYKNLFEPMYIGNVKIKNRFALAPMGPLGLSDAEGGFNQRGIDYYTERAKGGTGLIITGVTFVDNEIEEHSMPNVPCSTHNPVHFIRTAREMTERIHAYNAKVFLQMSGGFGRVTIPTNLGEFPPVAPSEIQHRWRDITCRALTISEIKTIVKKFGDGAYNAKRAGFDGVQIHAVHEGYLIDQFAISLFNNRTDEYGGSLENRLRFAKEIVEEIKDRCGNDFPVTLRYSPKSFIKDYREGALPGEDFIEKGRDLPEGIDAAKLLVKYGYDALDIDVGSYDSWWWSHPPMYQEKGLYMPYAKLMKETVDVPIICAGRMDNPEMASAAIANGVCDMISLGRPLLADADYVNKIKMNRYDLVRPCISCQEGCMGRIQEYSDLKCAVNPRTCRERSTKLTPCEKSKKVMVIGGGVAGAEVARVLAIRGHKPEIFEKSDKIGGNLLVGGVPDFKEDDILLAKWFENSLKELNVPIHFNTTVTKEFIQSKDFDTIIVSTGSKPKKIDLCDNKNVYTAEQVLLDESICGENVVIVGGGLVGCETALWLKKQGKNVKIVEILDKILAVNGPLCHANSDMLEELIKFNEIEVVCNTKIKEYKNNCLTLVEEDKEVLLPCDTVILSVGYSENNDLYNEIEFEMADTYLLGDARKVSNIMYAIWDAFEVGSNI